MIYCWFIYSASVAPPPPPAAPLISITVQRGGFLISCMKTMPLLFWLHLPNRAPAAHGDRWPPVITEYLIDPGRCVGKRQRVQSAAASPIRHACNVLWSQVNAPHTHTPSASSRVTLAEPWGALAGWMARSPRTYPPTHHAQVLLSGGLAFGPAVSILLITTRLYSVTALIRRAREWRE